MGDIPVPRSYSAVLGDIIDAFLSRFGIKRLKVGSPLLSIMEAAAQSDVRAAQDIFNALDTRSVDNTSGDALDRTAADENLKRISVTPATGTVDFSDTSFQKISTSVYQGAGAPIIGTTALKVTDATSFPTSGNIYIGRGTVNYEGPLAYSAAVFTNPYWTLTLTSGTAKFHNLGETVILAQKGVRQIPSGTIVQTPQGNVSDAIKFNTIYSKQIEDGENLLTGIEVVAQSPGIIGNVPSGAIKQLGSIPFVGAAVTNPLPYTNGLPAENDASLRERIKNARQTRQKGTDLTLVTSIKGVTSTQDNKTVVSSSIVKEKNHSTLYIDDGTGYEEAWSGVSQEVLMDSALGGEQLFQLSSQRPIARALVESTNTAPFNLSDGEKLSVNVGGILTEHTFPATSFRSISNASAFEIVSSINGNPSLLFNARTANNGANVVLVAKSDTNEDIQVVAPVTGNDANDILAFPTGLNYTLRLYKNDQLLFKDGKKAIVLSNPQNLWSPAIVNGDTLQIKVDGTSVQTVTFNDSDFITNNTGFTSVNANNSLISWATVFNSKVTGVTASATNGVLTLISNLGNSSRAQIEIVGGSLIAKSMFIVQVAVGQDNGYSLNRNTGQIKLVTPLAAGDSLVAATTYTRGYLQSQDFPTSTITLASTANLWVAVDGEAEILTTGVTSATPLTITSLATNRARYTATANTFGLGTVSYINPGDWVVIWDPQFTDNGMWRISALDTSTFAWFEVERSVVTAETKTPSSNGIVFSRTKEQLQNIQIASGVSIPLTTISTSFNSQLIGANSSIFRNTKLRLASNNYSLEGNLMIITADIQGQAFLFPMGQLVTNNPSHIAVIESENSESGTPGFIWTTVATVPSATTFTSTIAPSNLPLRSGDMVAYRKRLNVTNDRFGTNAYDYQSIQQIVAGVVTPRINSKSVERLINDRIYAASPFSTSWEDTLSIILDDDSSKNYNIPLFRRIVPLAGATYGTAPFEVRDADNGNSSLFNAFGASTTFFDDFALFMHARGKSHSIIANKTILYRLAGYGSSGDRTTFSFVNPSAPNLPFSISTNTLLGNANINLTLPSLTERTGLNINGNNYFVISSNTSYSASVGNVARAANVVTVTLAPAGVSNTNTLAIGDNVYQTTDEVNFPKGPKVITNVTANTFQYAEIGANAVSTITHTYDTSKRPAGTTNTVTALVSSGTDITATIGTHIFTAGQTIYFEPGHYDAVSTVEISAGAKVITSIGATTITWAEVTTAAAANLIAGVNYTVSAGKCQKITYVYFKGEVDVGALIRNASGVVSGTINVTPLISTHPFQIGDVIFLSPGEANFPAGPKILTAVTPTTFSYAEAGAAVASAAVETITSTSTDINLTGGGTPVAAGQIAHVDAATSLDTNVEGDFRVFSVSSTRFAILKDDSIYLGNTNPNKLGATSNLRFYPINAAAATASAVVSWINTNASTILTASLVPDNSGGANAGTAQETTATIEEYYLTTNNASLNGAGAQSISSFPLFDGLNWVKATNLLNAGSSTISLKDPVSGELTQYADFNNEAFRLVPITVNNFKNYLGSTGVSGFASNSIISSSSDGLKLQLGSSTIGSSGAIEIAGGSGNLASASIVGTGSIINVDGIATYSVASILANQSTGLIGDSWVVVQGSNKTPKVTAFNNTTEVQISSTGDPNEWQVDFSVSGQNVVTNVAYSAATSRTYQIEKQGRYMAYIETSGAPLSLASVKEGHLVNIIDTNLNSLNTGVFQIIRADSASNTFWIDNPNGVEEIATLTDTIQFITYDSASPGDHFVINSSVLGSVNMGSFLISRLDTNIATRFFIKGSLVAVGPIALGSDFIYFQIIEKNPIKLFKKIRTMNVNSINSNYLDVVFTTPDYATKISSNAASVILSLDKLNFNTDIVKGLDGYSYNTGLLAEVNKVVYGDEGNPSVYPGLVASGTNVDIFGPLVKRITVSLAVRLRTGISATDIQDRIKSAVASEINNTNVGISIALSDIVSAANSVDGVLAVTILSPLYNSGNDLISVQANEKPRVLDIINDILITIIQ